MSPVRWLVISGTLLATIFAHGDGRAAAGSQKKPVTHGVSIEGMQYSPSELSVHSGDWIVFSNKDLFPHTVTADGKSFDSNGIAANASWKFQAAGPGVYSYHCIFHPTMKGKITVR
jgi:plastocyanin